MASEAQIEANRRNARRSTGPRTEEGRAVSSGNALRHGLAAQQLVIPGEKAVDFEAFTEAMRAALKPGDAVEEQLAERIIFCAWRLRRASRAEAALANGEARRRSGLDLIDSSIMLHGVRADLGRYEAAVERALYRAYVALERRQARRAGEAVPAPVVLTLDGAAAPPGAGAPMVKICETNPIPPAPPVAPAALPAVEAPP